MAQPNAVPYDGRIAAKVREMEMAGVPRTKIYQGIQKYQNAPRSLTTFYKLYREDMDEVHGDLVQRIGSKVVQQAVNGDFKSQEFFLKSHGGWNTKEVVVNVDADAKDVDEGALDKLLGLLGKNGNDSEQTD